VATVRRELGKLPPTARGRLTLAGFVARLLANPLFRNSGFTVNLFRQALFTQLLEANIAPTRLTKDPLDQPLEVSVSGGKFVWPDRYWTLLGVFGGYLEDRSLDDLEVEAFETDAVLLITFHQAKGLEFDYVYVAGAGRNVDLGPALRTRLFSGTPVKYSFAAGLQTRNTETQQLALADRDREIYVALTRAKKRLTVLRDPNGELFMQDNPAITAIFKNLRSKRHPLNPKLTVQELSYE
jgi:DNA helicase-2/ATP-dependent DNA helicase PcrA